jgi:16S rRNA (cytosine967-C5)-methyltransferase
MPRAGVLFRQSRTAERVTGSRAAALAALLDVERGAEADDAVDHRAARAELYRRDRAQTMELVYGVLRHQLTLDWRLAQVAARPMGRLPVAVRLILRLGAYQLLYLSRIPPSAAVNESVKLAKRIARGPGRDWGEFVNGVLRALSRVPAAAWPDPAADPVQALSIRYSCPPWLVARWLARHGDAQAEVLCRGTLEIPPLALRCNTLRTSREALAAELRGAGLAVTPTTISPAGLIVEKSGTVTELPHFHDGYFYIEDEAAQLIPLLLALQPGEQVLDACAAPGGKTTHLAALMENRGEIVAVDRSAERLRLLRDNCRRLGASIVRPVAGDAGRLERDELGLQAGRLFDRILVDAPCSGLGVVRRHPEAKWRKEAIALGRHQATQLRLLRNTARLLRPGGIIVYSTCSTEPDENDLVIQRFCAEHPEFRREPLAPRLPPAGRGFLNAQGEFSTLFNTQAMDLFFAACLRKSDEEKE